VNLVDKHHRDDKSHKIARKLREPVQEIARQYDGNAKIDEILPGPPVLSPLVAEVYGIDYDGQIAIAKQVRAVSNVLTLLVIPVVDYGRCASGWSGSGRRRGEVPWCRQDAGTGGSLGSAGMAPAADRGASRDDRRPIRHLARGRILARARLRRRTARLDPASLTIPQPQRPSQHGCCVGRGSRRSPAQRRSGTRVPRRHDSPTP